MLSKEEIKEGIKQFFRGEDIITSKIVENDFGEFVLYVSIWGEKEEETIAYLTALEVERGLWEILDVKSYRRGIGKYLYYYAMSKVYPAWIMAESGGVSSDAKRIYDTFDKLDYVESEDLGEWETVGEADTAENNLINRKYRFSRTQIIKFNNE